MPGVECLSGGMRLSVPVPIPGKQSPESWSGEELSPLTSFPLLSVEDRGCKKKSSFYILKPLTIKLTYKEKE